MVRIATIGDGSCLLHAVCKALYPEYQNCDRLAFRSHFVLELRYVCSLALGWQNPEDPKGRTFYESMGDGAVADMARDYVPVPDEPINDFSERGLRELLQSTRQLGDEVYALLCELLYVNLHFVRLSSFDLHKHISVMHPTQAARCPNIIILVLEHHHYEVIGVQYPEGIQTVFRTNDVFLFALSKNASGFPS